MSDDFRTPGWPIGASESCLEWTAEQHLAVAKDLLDSNCVISCSEDAWNGRPPHRFYSAIDKEENPDVADPGPFLAAMIHVSIAELMYKMVP